MLVITGRGMPATAITAVRTGSTPSYGLISSLPEVRQQLFDEQAGRCAYCERKIRNPRQEVLTSTKIEHFHPRHAKGPAFTPDCAHASGARDGDWATVSWQNLMLCCAGVGRSGPTCDTAKANTDLCAEFRNPKNSPRELVSLVVVDGQGRAAPRTLDPDGRQQQIIDDTFGLNDPALVLERRAIIQALRRQVAGRRGLTPAQRRQLVQRLREEAEHAAFGSTLHSIADRLESRI